MRFSRARDLEILERTPAVVRTLVGGLSEAWTEADYGPDTWSARQIVAHYLDNEIHDWIPRVRWIIEHGDAAPFEPYDRDGWRAFADLSLGTLMDRFAAQRAASLDVLAELPLESLLDRPGVHPALGRVTMEQLLCAWVAHDLHHIGHLCKAMAHQHREDAGPWRAYLSILDPPAPR